MAWGNDPKKIINFLNLTVTKLNYENLQFYKSVI